MKTLHGEKWRRKEDNKSRNLAGIRKAPVAEI